MQPSSPKISKSHLARGVAACSAAALSVSALPAAPTSASMSERFNETIPAVIRPENNGSILLQAGSANVQFMKPGEWSVISNGSNWVLASSSKVEIAKASGDTVVNYQLSLVGPNLEKPITIRGSSGVARPELTFSDSRAADRSRTFAAAMESPNSAVLITPEGTPLRLKEGIAVSYGSGSSSVSFTLEKRPIAGESAGYDFVIQSSAGGKRSEPVRIAQHSAGVRESRAQTFTVE